MRLADRTKNFAKTVAVRLVRTTPEHLKPGGNRDAKATLNDAGRKATVWLFNAPLPPNVLLQNNRKIGDRIMSHSSGQARINNLFRSALCQIMGRAAVAADFGEWPSKLTLSCLRLIFQASENRRSHTPRAQSSDDRQLPGGRNLFPSVPFRLSLGIRFGRAGIGMRQITADAGLVADNE